jgi:2-keto-4-pentenoate hydratase/2-oxohepta-3-ene-1,7-dioic acid hydratase in catechol pathway
LRIGLTTDKGALVPVVEHDGELRTVPSLRGADASALLALGDRLSADPPPLGDVVDADALGVPLRPSKIVAIGLNYMDHVRESGVEPPKQPLVFAKFPSSLVASGQPIVIDPALTSRVDWEVELAVVIGRSTAGVAPRDALECIWGYTVVNDVSARDVQFSDGQWIRGKSMDTFCPIAPLLVSRDEVADPQSLRLLTRVNGEVVQDSTTAEMIFSVAELLAFCASNFTLLPGDLLLTGTPWGCGEFMEPPRHLHPGDVVEVEIPGLCVVTNPVTVVPASRA